MNKSIHAWVTAFAGTSFPDCYIPQVWAQESLMILEAHMVAANLVYRDFEDEIATQGDTVNTRKPGEFTAVNKIDSDSVTDQTPTATNVAVVLNQHLHTTFVIKDGQESKGIKSLIAEYLNPAALSMANAIDQIICGQVYQFMSNEAGKLDTTPTRAGLIDLREVMNSNKVPQEGRNLLVCPDTEGSLLNVADFLNAEKVGDEGTTLREGSLGRKFGFDTYMCQNVSSIANAADAAVTGAVNLSAGYAIGSTVIAVDGFSLTGTAAAGCWCTIAGDMIPQRITSAVGGGGACTSITVSPGLVTAVVNDAVVTIYQSGDVNLTAGYAADWTKPIVTSIFSATHLPKTGQLVSFGTGSSTDYYAPRGTPVLTSMQLGNQLDTAIVDAEKVNIGPNGDFNFAFHRNALALVTRPLALPPSGTGAMSFVANYNGLSIRVTMTYDGSAQGVRVTLDCLLGVKVLDSDLGAVYYA